MEQEQASEADEHTASQGWDLTTNALSKTRGEINKHKEKVNDEEFLRKYNELMRAPVYVDSPLAISATEVFRQNMELVFKYLLFF